MANNVSDQFFEPSTDTNANFGNSVSGQTNSFFLPKIYSKQVLNFFRKASVVEAITNTDYAGEISAFELSLISLLMLLISCDFETIAIEIILSGYFRLISKEFVSNLILSPVKMFLGFCSSAYIKRLPEPTNSLSVITIPEI